MTVVNARAVAAQRGIEIIESRSSRPRDFANLLSVKLHTSDGERWVEGTVFEPGSAAADARSTASRSKRRSKARCSSSTNEDQPGVIGEVGTILGRHGVNIANFALGRGTGGAVGVVNIDVPQAENGTDRTRTRSHPRDSGGDLGLPGASSERGSETRRTQVPGFDRPTH